MPQPWARERRAVTMERIKKEAKRAAGRLGAQGAVMIAFYQDGEHFHVIDAGTAPMPLPELYRMLLSAGAIVQDSGGQDVKVN